MQRENAYALRGFPQAGQNVLRPSPIPSTVQTLFFDFTPLSFKFYIKPQRSASCTKTSCSCILSKIYIKPQRENKKFIKIEVVSYQKSTSNHNHRGRYVCFHGVYLIKNLHQTTTNHFDSVRRRELYLIKNLHQTTTSPINDLELRTLYLIKNLHQTTTSLVNKEVLDGCILSKIYIKPQLCSPLARRIYGCILSKIYIKPQLWLIPQND